LVVSSLIAIWYCIPAQLYSSFYFYSNVTIPVIDTIIQLFICYICVTLGASDKLNRFDCCLVDDGRGSYQLKFFLKEIEEHTFDEEQQHDNS
jgi:hypothetical protein